MTEGHCIFLHSESWWEQALLQLMYTVTGLLASLIGMGTVGPSVLLAPARSLPSASRSYGESVGALLWYRAPAHLKFNRVIEIKGSERQILFLLIFIRSSLLLLSLPYVCLPSTVLALLTLGLTPNAEITVLNSQHDQLPQLWMSNLCNIFLILYPSKWFCFSESWMIQKNLLNAYYVLRTFSIFSLY